MKTEYDKYHDELNPNLENKRIRINAKMFPEHEIPDEDLEDYHVKFNADKEAYHDEMIYELR